MDKDNIKNAYCQTINSANTGKIFAEQQELGAPRIIHMPHGEWVPTLEDVNNIQTVLAASANFLDSTLSLIADESESIVEEIEIALSKIEETVRTQEILADNLKILNGDYGDNVVIETLTEEDFGGYFDYQDDAFYPYISSESDSPLEVVSVVGNGYEGNKYALDTSTTFLEDVVTPKQQYMTDGDKTTYFEYSRITAPNDGRVRPIHFNSFYEDLKCTVTLSSKNLLTVLKIESVTESLILSSLETSMDGETWTTEIVSQDEMMNTKAREANNPYAFGTGRIDVTPCYYVRLTFKNLMYDPALLAYSEGVTKDDD